MDWIFIPLRIALPFRRGRLFFRKLGGDAVGAEQRTFEAALKVDAALAEIVFAPWVRAFTAIAAAVVDSTLDVLQSAVEPWGDDGAGTGTRAPTDRSPLMAPAPPPSGAPLLDGAAIAPPRSMNRAPSLILSPTSQGQKETRAAHAAAHRQQQQDLLQLFTFVEGEAFRSTRPGAAAGRR